MLNSFLLIQMNIGELNNFTDVTQTFSRNFYIANIYIINKDLINLKNFK
jgi:hypothetical protein